jgi:DNA polymerase/3'-5' exonuclease PolX
MSVESAIEQKIKEAMARGEFDNLSGAGKPIDLDAYFNTPEDLRMAFAMLKSNEFVPEEVEIFKEISELDEKIKTCSDEGERERLTAKRGERRLKLTLLLDARRRRR